jgi:arylsulfatase A-like enzyme
LSRRAFPRGLGLIGVAVVMTVLLIAGLVVVALIQRPHRTASVVLVVLDTVRIDHLTPYGYAKETTPRLLQFAQEGLLFERARSAAPWTLSSHASIFTGKLPSQHGCDWEHRWLADGQETIAEVLKREKFETFGVTTNVNASSIYNLHQGFDRFVETWSLRESRRGRDDSAIANEEIRAWLDRRPDPARPFFLFVNYADAHLPYAPPPPLDRMFGAASDRARALASRGDLLRGVLSGEVKLTADDVAGLTALYDGELRKVDGLFGDLLDDLAQRGLRDDTLVIVVADHGELLGEDGLVDHQLSLREELLHVPLVIRWPRMVRPGRVPEPVSLTEIKPWLDSLARGRVPAWSPSPDRALEVIDSEYARPVDLVDFVRAHGRDAAAIDVRLAAAWRRDGAGGQKLVLRDGANPRLFRIPANGREEAWVDPPEELVAALSRALEHERALGRFREAGDDLSAGAQPSAGALEELRALGYVGVQARPSLSLHASEHWAAGERALARREPAAALIELKRAAHLAPQEPELLLALARLADAESDEGRAEALELYLRAVAGSAAASGADAAWARARLRELAPDSAH